MYINIVIKLHHLDSSDDRNDSEINHQQQSEFLIKLNEKISEKEMDVSFAIKIIKIELPTFY